MRYQQLTFIFLFLFSLTFISAAETWKYNYLDQGQQVITGANYSINVNHSTTSDYANFAGYGGDSDKFHGLDYSDLYNSYKTMYRTAFDKIYLKLTDSSFQRTGTTITPTNSNDVLNITSNIISSTISGSAVLTQLDDPSEMSLWYADEYTWNFRVYGYDGSQYSTNYIQATGFDDDGFGQNIVFNWTITSSETFSHYKILVNNGGGYIYSVLTTDKIGGLVWDDSEGEWVGGDISTDVIVTPSTSYTNNYSLITDIINAQGITWSNDVNEDGQIVGDTDITGELVVNGDIYASDGSVQISNGTLYSNGLKVFEATLIWGRLMNSLNNGTYSYGLGSNSGTPNVNYITAMGGFSGYNVANAGEGFSSFGAASMRSATNGEGSSSFGRQSGYSQNGKYNTNLGYSAGLQATTNDSIFIGARAGALKSYDNPVFVVSSTTSYLSINDIPNKSFLYGEMDPTGNVSNMWLKLNGVFKQDDNNKIIQGSEDDYETYYDGTNQIYNLTNGGQFMFYGGNISVEGINYHSEVDTSENALEWFKDGSEMLNENGTINHQAFEECYFPEEITDYSRPEIREYVMQNCTIIDLGNDETDLQCVDLPPIEETYYPHKTIRDSISGECMYAKQNQALALLNKNIDVYPNLTDFNNKIMVEDFFFQSKAVNSDIDYTSIFSDIVPFLTKHKSKYAVNLTLPDTSIIQGDNAEEQIKDLQGYVLQNEFCRKNNKKYDDYNLCMDNGETLGDKIK